MTTAKAPRSNKTTNSKSVKAIKNLAQAATALAIAGVQPTDKSLKGALQEVKKADKETAPKGKHSKSLRTLLAVKEAQESAPKATKTPKAKHELAVSGSMIRTSELVGVHFQAKIDSAPQLGDMLMLTTAKGIEIPLIVSCWTPIKTNEEAVLIQAFITKKSGDHLHMIKDSMAKIEWK